MVINDFSSLGKKLFVSIFHVCHCEPCNRGVAISHKCMQPLNKTKIFFLIFIAVAIGAIYFLPNILIPHFYNQEDGSNYTWRDMAFYSFEEIFSYGTSISNIMRGHWLGGDPFLWEYKNMPTSWDYYPLALVIGLFFKLFQLSDPSMLFVVGDFIFPPISFLIIFLLFHRITKFFLLSIFSSIVFLYFPSIFIFKKILSIDFYGYISLTSVSDLFTDIAVANADFSRLFVPGITMIFLSAFLFFSYCAISEKTIKKRWLILAGISYGLLFYVYFYYWFFVTISLGFLSVFLFFPKKDCFWRVIKIFLYGLVVSVPYWIRFFILAGNPIYSELTQRVGLLRERVLVTPGGGYWAILFIFLLAGLIFFQRARRNILFFYVLSFLASVPVVKNLQLIFGFNPQPDHWGSRVTVYFIVFAVLVLVFWLIQRLPADYKKLSSLVLLAATIFLLVIMSAGQIIKSQCAYLEAAFFMNKDMIDSFGWINKNTESDSVFLTDSEITRTALSFYTHANVYIPHACLSLATNSEIQERYEVVYAIYKVPIGLLEDSFRNNFGNNEKYTYAQRRNLNNNFSMFCATYGVLSGHDTIGNYIPGDVVSAFIAKYKIIRPDIKSLGYRADYLFDGPYERTISNFNVGEYPELNLAYSNNSVKIYKIIN